MAPLVERLWHAGRGDPFDRMVFSCAIAIGLSDARRPLTEALGLAPLALAHMLNAYFPGCWRYLPARTRGDSAGDDEIEEPDLRRLLLDHRACGRVEEDWLACILARRSLYPNHLWQDLGLFDRDALNTLMDRHFHRLRLLNRLDMKWKKFFYRQLCEREGVAICKAPTCDACTDVGICFGAEAGEPLSVLQFDVSDTRQIRRPR